MNWLPGNTHGALSSCITVDLLSCSYKRAVKMVGLMIKKSKEKQGSYILFFLFIASVLHSLWDAHRIIPNG